MTTASPLVPVIVIAHCYHFLNRFIYLFAWLNRFLLKLLHVGNFTTCMLSMYCWAFSFIFEIISFFRTANLEYFMENQSLLSKDWYSLAQPKLLHPHTKGRFLFCRLGEMPTYATIKIIILFTSLFSQNISLKTECAQIPLILLLLNILSQTHYKVSGDLKRKVVNNSFSSNLLFPVIHQINIFQFLDVAVLLFWHAIYHSLPAFKFFIQILYPLMAK